MGPLNPKEKYNFWSKFNLREEVMNFIFLNDDIFISFKQLSKKYGTSDELEVDDRLYKYLNKLNPGDALPGTIIKCEDCEMICFGVDIENCTMCGRLVCKECLNEHGDRYRVICPTCIYENDIEVD